jgi:TonB family protein
MALFSCRGVAQPNASAQPDAVTLPSDPKELLLLAAKLNGLTGDDLKPWHMKASFTILNASGKVANQGTIEEFWAGPHLSKTIYISAGFSQTTYETEKGLFSSGNSHAPPLLFRWAAEELVSPIPFSTHPALLDRAQIKLQSGTAGNNKLRCLSLLFHNEEKPVREFRGPGYCLQDALPIVRITSYAGNLSQTIYNRILLFQGHYVSGALEIGANGRVVLRANLDELEKIASINSSDFTPPPDSIPVHRIVELLSIDTQKQLIKKAPPDYPPIARAARVQGDVVLRVHIDSDGHVSDQIVLSGPAMLQQAAIDGVRQWVYKPFQVDGEPVEVDMVINVIFTLSGPFVEIE